ncbi:MAG: hypothetical protein ACLP05_14370 [Candidatus Kryptoniota bacterium]
MKDADTYFHDYLSGYTREKLGDWVFNSSHVWIAFPRLLSTPIFPIAIIFFAWWEVLIALVIAMIIRIFVRHRYFNPYLMDYGLDFIKLRWLTAIGSFAFLVSNHTYLPAVLALLYPWLIGNLIGSIPPPKFLHRHTTAMLIEFMIRDRIEPVCKHSSLPSES